MTTETLATIDDTTLTTITGGFLPPGAVGHAVKPVKPAAPSKPINRNPIRFL